MQRITLQFSGSLLEDALLLRAQCFPGPKQTKPAADEFDARSVHITLHTDQTLIAYGRLTIGKPGVFKTWSNGTAELPEGDHVADLGRCCVNPNYRRLELLRAVCLETFIYAQDIGLHCVNGACIPGRFLGATLEAIGYVKTGNPVNEFEPNGNAVLIQPLTCNLWAHTSNWQTQQTLYTNHLARYGFLFEGQSISEIAPKGRDQMMEEHLRINSRSTKMPAA